MLTQGEPCRRGRGARYCYSSRAPVGALLGVGQMTSTFMPMVPADAAAAVRVTTTS